MHPIRFYNTLIVLILMVSLLAPGPVLAEDLPPEKATPTGIIAQFTTVEESAAPSDPRLAEGAALQAVSFSKIFLPLTRGSGGSAPVLQPFTVTNKASYPVVALIIDSYNYFPTSPMGILPGGNYKVNLYSGTHTYKIITGHWDTNTRSRFDMYVYSGQFSTPQYNSLTVEDVTLAGILTQFNSSGMGYWEGYYFDNNSDCYTTAFKFYSDYTYKFYVSNTIKASGVYNEVPPRNPSLYSLTFNVGLTEKALLMETEGMFYLRNGPPPPSYWNQITYVYKPQGYVSNPFCP